MNALTVTPASVAVLVALGAAAGGLGALVGIGGGVLLVPGLVIALGVPMHDAVAASLVCVVATSTATGSVYVGAGLANMRLGMTLEIATTLGGVSGGLVALLVAPSLLAALFALVLAVTALLLLRGGPAHEAESKAATDHEESLRGWEERGRIAGAYHDVRTGRVVPYEAQRIGLGSAVAFVAGAMSGMLGVGGGFLKVPAMTLGMRVPLRVAAATSNFMIGVTALASLSVYLLRGQVRPLLAAPLVVGVVAGSLGGAWLARRVSVRALQLVLAVVLAGVAIQMGVRAFGGVDAG